MELKKLRRHRKKGNGEGLADREGIKTSFSLLIVPNKITVHCIWHLKCSNIRTDESRNKMAKEFHEM